AAAYLKYASLGPSLAALHPDLFEQPGRKQVFQRPAKGKGIERRSSGCVEPSVDRRARIW
ncbi:MAG: hypothetical protein WCI75_08765, partial [candidate division NC10 bacterium]